MVFVSFLSDCALFSAQICPSPCEFLLRFGLPTDFHLSFFVSSGIICFMLTLVLVFLATRPATGVRGCIPLEEEFPSPEIWSPFPSALLPAWISYKINSWQTRGRQYLIFVIFLLSYLLGNNLLSPVVWVSVFEKFLQNTVLGFLINLLFLLLLFIPIHFAGTDLASTFKIGFSLFIFAHLTVTRIIYLVHMWSFIRLPFYFILGKLRKIRKGIWEIFPASEK